MKICGFAGRILHVDLTRKKTAVQPLDLEVASKYLGGFGVNNFLTHSLLEPQCDPLGEKNILVLGAGPLVGTGFPGISKTIGTTKSPQQGNILASAGSMGLGPWLKWAGYDHVVITGKSAKPVYLEILDDQIEVREAERLWGQDIHTTTDALWEKYGTAGVLAIGPAGENQVVWSLGIVDQAASLGRGGLGAVMGSKGLKAVVAKGSRGIQVADAKKVKRLMKDLFQRTTGYRFYKDYLELGVMANWEKNFLPMKFSARETAPERIDELYGLRGYRRVKKCKIACPSCVIADKDLVVIQEGAYAGLTSPLPSFLNVAILGYRLDIPETTEAVKLLDVLDGYGLDFLMFSALADFLLFLFERGILGPEDTQGFHPRREITSYLQLADLVARREGWGALLARGWEALLQTIERKVGQTRLKEILQEGAVSGHTYGLGKLKGLEWVAEPRDSHLGTMEFTQVVSPRGGQVASGIGPTYVLGLPVEFFRKSAEDLGASPESMKKIFDSPFGFNVGRMTRYTEDWYSALNCLGICGRMMNSRAYTFETCAALYSAVTGIDLSVKEVMRASERVWNLYKLLNIREGFGVDDDQYPEEWSQPLRVRGGEKRMLDYYKKQVLTRADLLQLRRDYYDERGWDPETGIPSKAKLMELGLEDFS